jgi:hypothetical protein
MIALCSHLFLSFFDVTSLNSRAATSAISRFDSRENLGRTAVEVCEMPCKGLKLFGGGEYVPLFSSFWSLGSFRFGKRAKCECSKHNI